MFGLRSSSLLFKVVDAMKNTNTMRKSRSTSHLVGITEEEDEVNGNNTGGANNIVLRSQSVVDSKRSKRPKSWAKSTDNVNLIGDSKPNNLNNADLQKKKSLLKTILNKVGSSSQINDLGMEQEPMSMETKPKKTKKKKAEKRDSLQMEKEPKSASSDKSATPAGVQLMLIYIPR